MKLQENWRDIRRLFTQVFQTSLHYSMATVTPDGMPHVTPVGSLLLREPGHAIYFEEFTQRMPANFRDNQNVCVLAVRSGRWFWLSSLLRGGFRSPPAIRLHGTVGPHRAATEEEIAAWQRRVGRLRFTRGHRMMWANMRTVRDVYLTRADGIYLGEMTRECWAHFGAGDAATG
ncbi:MAG TPA: pyridoxamine 5'-phosphate oxidase family protein [Steroidobacteraceae bacterium]